MSHRRRPAPGRADARRFPWTSASDIGPLLVAAVGITLVSLTDTIATATSFAARRGDEVEPDQEMIGMGAANITAGLFQGFAVSTSGSRTAVAEQSGAKSQLTGVVGAGLVVVLLCFLNSLLADLPQSALAAVVIAAALSLIDLRHPRALPAGAPERPRPVARRHRRRRLLRRAPGHRRGHRPRRSCCSSAATGGPTAPCSARSTASTAGTASTATPKPSQIPGIVVYRWEAPLFFANAGAFRHQIRHLAREHRPAVDRPAVRGDHRHRRHRGGHARAARRRAQRPGHPPRVRRDADPPAGADAALRADGDARPPTTSTRRSRWRLDEVRAEGVGPYPDEEGPG